MSFYSAEELQTLGLASFGEDVRISRKASIYNPGRISIGNHVRIDDFVCSRQAREELRSVTMSILRFIARLSGAGKIKLNDFVTCHPGYPSIRAMMITAVYT